MLPRGISNVKRKYHRARPGTSRAYGVPAERATTLRPVSYRGSLKPLRRSLVWTSFGCTDML